MNAFDATLVTLELLDTTGAAFSVADVASGLATVSVIAEPHPAALLGLGLVALAGSRGRATRTEPTCRP